MSKKKQDLVYSQVENSSKPLSSRMLAKRLKQFDVKIGDIYKISEEINKSDKYPCQLLINETGFYYLKRKAELPKTLGIKTKSKDANDAIKGQIYAMLINSTTPVMLDYLVRYFQEKNSRKIRRIIREMRLSGDYGCIVLGSKGGYMITKDPNRITGFIKDLQSKISGMKQVIAKMNEELVNVRRKH